MMAITIKKPGGCIGAEVQGIDLTSSFDDETFRRVEEAFCKYSVLVFRDQDLNDDQHVSFSGRFGPLEMSMVNDPSGGGGPINNISNVNEKGEIIPTEDKRMIYISGNLLWHSDSSYKKVPSKASLLFAIEVPPEGGETEYASMKAAYAALPKEKKADLKGLVAEHSLAYSRSLIDPDAMNKEFKDEVPPMPQSVVRTIPETGEKTLFVGAHASHIIGWPAERGRALLQELLDWSTKPQFVYQHRWRRKDLVMWDNRCCLHRGRPWNAARYHRVMHRTTIAGEGPAV